MKGTVLQENLLLALRTVQGAISTRSTLPVLGNILIQMKDGKMTVAATDLSLAISCDVVASVSIEGAITLPGETLVALVSYLDAEAVDMHVNMDTLVCNIQCGRTEANMRGISHEEFPLLPSLDQDNATAINADVLTSMIKQVVFVVSRNHHIGAFNGVNIELKSGQLSMTATDSFRLSVRKEPSDNVKVNESFIVDKSAMSEVMKTVRAHKFEDDIFIEVGKQVIFKVGHVTIISHPIDGQYPDVSKAIQTKINMATVCNRMELLRCVKTVSIVSSVVDGRNQVVIDFGQKEVIVHTKESKAIVDTEELVGEPMQIIFSASYLIAALSAMDSAYVRFKANTKMLGTIIEPVGLDGFVHVIMPMAV